MESEFVNWLSQRLAPNPTEVAIGIGDDAAVVHSPDDSLVVATDLLCEGVHFLTATSPLRSIGRKALAVNLSDFAAMAAVPQFAVVSLLWPRRRKWQEACELYEGLLDLAEAHNVSLVGGDTNSWDGPLCINVTLMGHPTPRGVLTRSAAIPGDAILVTGPLGGSLLGHHLDFEPRVAEALRLHRRYDLHAAMDITDGLLLDLERMTKASQVGAELDLATVPISDAAYRQANSEMTKSEQIRPEIAPDAQSELKSAALQHALTDGEDFELLLTTDVSTAQRMIAEQSESTLQLVRIGTIVETPGIYRVADDERQPICIQGYLH